MAVKEENYSNRVSIKLDAGEDDSGNVITKTVSLSTLKADEFSDEDKQKAYNIATALDNLFEYSRNSIVFTNAGYLEEA